jgi:hypothetical protein
VFFDPALDRDRKLGRLVDPAELVEETPMVEIEVAVDQDVAEADGTGQTFGEDSRITPPAPSAVKASAYVSGADAPVAAMMCSAMSAQPWARSWALRATRS